MIAVFGFRFLIIIILIVLFSFWLVIGLFILNDEIYYDEDSRLQTLDSIKYLMHLMYLNVYYKCIEFGNFTNNFEILHQITSTFYLFSNFQFVDMLKLTINLAAHYSTYRELTYGLAAVRYVRTPSIMIRQWVTTHIQTCDRAKVRSKAETSTLAHR